MAAYAHRRDRRIGPIGTIARAAVGAAFAIVPIALGGINWLHVAALAAYMPIATATVTAISAGSAWFSVDLRFNPEQDLETELARLTDTISEAAARAGRR